MARLEIRLLGGFEVLRDGAPRREFRTRKARALLAYLALRTGRPLSRAALAGLLWPDQPSARAAQSLRQSLTFLRDALGAPSPLAATRDDVTLHLTDEHVSDVAVFERQLAAGLRAPGQVKALTEAANLYRGALLDGFFLDDAPEFETWLVAERERLQAGALEALEQLAEFHLTRGEYASAKDRLYRALALDPWRETAHRGLMRALALAGDPAAALAQYEKCRRTLREGLGVEPLELTQSLYQHILDRASDLIPTALPAQAASRPQPAFAGRADEHAQLASVLAALNARGQRVDQPMLLLIEGEAGAGKTRLVEEFARFAASQGTIVLSGRCFEFGERVAYQPIVEALRSALSTRVWEYGGMGVSPPTRPAELQASHIPALSPIWLAELSRLLPELRESRPDLPEPQPASGEAARQRLFEAVMRGLRALTESQRPVLLFLDDLHWADTSTLDLLHYLARHAAGHATLFVGTHRPEETPADHPLTHLRRGLSRDRLVQSLSLKPLAPEALQTITANLIEGDAAHELARYLYRESEGNPFVMTEALNTLYESGALQAGPGGKWSLRVAPGEIAPGAGITTGLRDTILRRVDQLPEAARRALQLASAIGRNFDAALLREVAGAEADSCLEAWLDHRLVRPVPGARAGYDFAHDKIREVVYRDLSESRRQSVHGEVAAALVRLNGPSESAAPALAHHYLSSAEPRRALPFLLAAAQQAERAFALSTVARVCTQALELEPDDLELRFEFLRLRQRAHEFLGQPEAEGADAEAMLAVAEALGSAQRNVAALLRLGLYHSGRGQMPLARSAIERALALARELGDAAGEVDALIQQAQLIRDADGDPHRAFDLLEEGRQKASAAGNRAGEAFILGHLGILRAERGEYAAAVQNYQDCLALLRELGERSALAGYLNPLASAYRALGQFALAEAALAEAMRISVELGHSTIQGWTHLNFGKLALWRRQPPEARESFERALALAAAHRLPLIEAQAHLGWGQADLAESNFESAREQLARAVEICAQTDAGLLALSRAYLAQAHLGLGEVEAAKARSREAAEAVTAGRGTFIEPQQAYWCHYCVLNAAGEIAEARRWLEKGRALVLAQAEGLGANWRASFLEAVPINRGILAAWEEDQTQSYPLNL